MLVHLVKLTRKPFIVALTVNVFLQAGCSSSPNGAAQVEKLPVIHPIVTDTATTLEYVADIHSLKNVELRARVRGFMERIHVDEGESVQAGQLLFSMGSQEFRQELLKARAAVASAVADAKVAEVELLNARTLVEKNVVSKTELELAQAKWDAAKARVEEAKAHEVSANLQLSFTEIRAPYNGIINRIPNKPGSLVDEGELLTTLSDNLEVFAYFNVSESDYLDLVEHDSETAQQQVELVMANQQVHPFKGVIETVEGEVDKATGNIAFRARFKNPDLTLKHGSTGKIRLIKEIKNAMMIPQKATVEIQDALYVFRVDEQNRIHLQNVKPAMRIPHLYILESGLAPSDRIIFEGVQRVRDGDRIEPDLVPVGSIRTQTAGA